MVKLAKHILEHNIQRWNLHLTTTGIIPHISLKWQTISFYLHALEVDQIQGQRHTPQDHELTMQPTALRAFPTTRIMEFELYTNYVVLSDTNLSDSPFEVDLARSCNTKITAGTLVSSASLLERYLVGVDSYNS